MLTQLPPRILESTLGTAAQFQKYWWLFLVGMVVEVVLVYVSAYIALFFGSMFNWAIGVVSLIWLIVNMFFFFVLNAAFKFKPVLLTSMGAIFLFAMLIIAFSASGVHVLGV